MILVNNIVLLQARMGSSRLPGKTLKELCGSSLLEWCVIRLREIKNVTDVVVVTSTKPDDDEIEKVCREKSFSFFRGSELNVLQRYTLAAEKFNADNIIRATADNPLVDFVDATQLLGKHISEAVDYSSNKSEVGTLLPNGLGIEIFSRSALELSFKKSTQPHHFEHVNEYILENKSEFIINSGSLFDIECTLDFTIDTLSEFLFVEDFIQNKNITLKTNIFELLKHENIT